MWYQFQRLVPNDATLCAACTNSLTGYGCSAQTLLETPSARGVGHAARLRGTGRSAWEPAWRGGGALRRIDRREERGGPAPHPPSRPMDPVYVQGLREAKELLGEGVFSPEVVRVPCPS